MAQIKQIVECIPNFSEGRDQFVINSIAASIKKVEGVKLLHVDTGYSANRTVYTMAGNPKAVINAVFEACKVAMEKIDMTKHHGEHPRIGIMDVCPIVPIIGISMEDCVNLSHELANIIGRYFKIPVFCYAESALHPERTSLSYIRKGGYEGLRRKIKKRQWIPDFGPHLFSEKKGATVIGARDFLLAYNINLGSKDVNTAKYIASKIRESGFSNHCGDQKINFEGRLKHVKAIGWYIDEFGKAQVSTNITNFRETGLHDVYEEIKSIADGLGVEVTGSELVGLIPKKALIDSGIFYSKKESRESNVNSDAYILSAIKNLILNDIEPFVAEERIIEELIEIHLGYDVIIS